MKPAVVALVALLAVPACGRATAGGDRRVELTAHYSAWSRTTVTVPHGVPIRFVLRNDDPIGHEFIVGDQGVQDRHEQGTEPKHGARPTEVDLRSLSTSETSITFDRPGTLFFACHLPGHYAYGMRGVIEVR